MKYHTICVTHLNQNNPENGNLLTEIKNEDTGFTMRMTAEETVTLAQILDHILEKHEYKLTPGTTNTLTVTEST